MGARLWFVLSGSGRRVNILRSRARRARRVFMCVVHALMGVDLCQSVPVGGPVAVVVVPWCPWAGSLCSPLCALVLWPRGCQFPVPHGL